MRWRNERISWDPAQFCGITRISIPRDTIWVPDLFIYEEELQLFPFSNSCRATQFSRDVIRTQGEWEFLQISVTSLNVTYYGRTWEQLIYTRRPLLHVINFLLPILFFLSLDLASFFINDHRGEKLGFKVTVLLAISVLLLILNEILPAMSNKTPLIGTEDGSTETNKAPPSPYLSISSDGLVSFQNNHMLISTCRMHVYKFPFDTQSCN
uniref:Uncharacterized protein n=1 Tax=Mola mola TaxID=94237 RepID=A0A3Q3XKG1_MOLML